MSPQQQSMRQPNMQQMRQMNVSMNAQQMRNTMNPHQQQQQQQMRAMNVPQHRHANQTQLFGQNPNIPAPPSQPQQPGSVPKEKQMQDTENDDIYGNYKNNQSQPGMNNRMCVFCVHG